MEVLRSIQIYGFFHEERFIFEYDRLIKAKKKDLYHICSYLNIQMCQCRHLKKEELIDYIIEEQGYKFRKMYHYLLYEFSDNNSHMTDGRNTEEFEDYLEYLFDCHYFIKDKVLQSMMEKLKK